jgi:hypothetical protein
MAAWRSTPGWHSQLLAEAISGSAGPRPGCGPARPPPPALRTPGSRLCQGRATCAGVRSCSARQVDERGQLPRRSQRAGRHQLGHLEGLDARVRRRRCRRTPPRCWWCRGRCR